MKYIQGNTNPGMNWAATLETFLLGSYGFEVYNVFPTFISIPEWPESEFLGDPTGSADTQSIFKAASWGNRIRIQGTRQSWGIQGITRDMYGTPLANCVVKLFRTSTDELLYSTISDGNGYFQTFTPYNEACYLVAYKPGTPDIMGATVNTLIGS